MTVPAGSYRAVVVDDEPDARQAVTTLLAEEPRIAVVGEAASGRQAVELVRRLEPDLLFLDVQMPELDGFAVLEALAERVPAGVVFVTAHDEHALRAFEVHALDYVLKPFGRPRFGAAVARALARLDAAEAFASRTTVAALLARRVGNTAPGALASADPSVRPTRLAVRLGTRTILVRVEDVDWVEADGDYARLNAGGTVHLLSDRLAALERLLGSERFCRIHRSVLVNLERIQELHREPDGSGFVLLDRGVRLRVARGRWDDLTRALGVAG